jgi:hypothetical protein
MHLSDLLQCVVVDDSGVELGPVRDVRLVRDGPVVGTFGASFRVSGLVVGIGALGARLGYERGDVERPVALRALFGRLARRGQLVAWSDVASVEEGRIRLRPDARPRPLTPAEGGESGR